MITLSTHFILFSKRIRSSEQVQYIIDAAQYDSMPGALNNVICIFHCITNDALRFRFASGYVPARVLRYTIFMMKIYAPSRPDNPMLYLVLRTLGVFDDCVIRFYCCFVSSSTSSFMYAVWQRNVFCTFSSMYYFFRIQLKRAEIIFSPL